MSKYNIIIIPEGAILPEELSLPIAPKGDIIERIAAGRTQPVVLEASTRELQALVEYRDLFDVDVTAVVGLHGAMYNTIWNTYVSTMKRVTVDMLAAQQQERNNALADAGQQEVTNPQVRRSGFPQFARPTAASSGDTADANDDSDTGDLG